jgi:hypothetical protein
MRWLLWLFGCAHRIIIVTHKCRRVDLRGAYTSAANTKLLGIVDNSISLRGEEIGRNASAVLDDNNIGV